MPHGQSQRSSFLGKFRIYLDRVVVTVLQGTWGLGGEGMGEIWNLIPLTLVLWVRGIDPTMPAEGKINNLVK